MVFERTSFRAALMVVAIVSSAVGCGGDECASASAHLTECLAASDAPIAASATSTTCEGEPACSAGCITGAECSALKDFYSPNRTEASKAILDCFTKCQSL